MTEFEDRWPYAPAPGDITFAISTDQRPLERQASLNAPTDPILIGLSLLAMGTLGRRRWRAQG